MNDFLLSTRPIHVSDYMGNDFFDSSHEGCAIGAAFMVTAEEKGNRMNLTAKKPHRPHRAM